MFASASFLAGNDRGKGKAKDCDFNEHDHRSSELFIASCGFNSLPIWQWQTSKDQGRLRVPTETSFLVRCGLHLYRWTWLTLFSGNAKGKGKEVDGRQARGQHFFRLNVHSINSPPCPTVDFKDKGKDKGIDSVKGTNTGGEFPFFRNQPSTFSACGA
jgi:hypothetical protein